MDKRYPKCPKCEYQRDEFDRLVHELMCPACGIIYSKWPPKAPVIKTEVDAFQYEETLTLWETLKDCFLGGPDKVDSFVFKGRVFAFVVIVLWGFYFISGGIDASNVVRSFLHSVNLPFHEFGHVLFRPLGRFWTILGGSLFQVLLPFLLMFAFSLKQRDNFGAAVMLWWCGQNFIDVSLYIADAQHRALPLILGLGKESHDWGNLLRMTDNLDNTYFIANVSFSIGCFIIVLSLLWAGTLLMKQKKVLT